VFNGFRRDLVMIGERKYFGYKKLLSEAGFEFPES